MQEHHHIIYQLNPPPGRSMSLNIPSISIVQYKYSTTKYNIVYLEEVLELVVQDKRRGFVEKFLFYRFPRYSQRHACGVVMKCQMFNSHRMGSIRTVSCVQISSFLKTETETEIPTPTSGINLGCQIIAPHVITLQRAKHNIFVKKVFAQKSEPTTRAKKSICKPCPQPQHTFQEGFVIFMVVYCDIEYRALLFGSGFCHLRAQCTILDVCLAWISFPLFHHASIILL